MIQMEKKNKILFWMCLSMIISYLPWYNFSAVLSYISTEFRFSASDTGQIIAAFQCGYVIIVLLTGWLSDKIDLKRIIVLSTFLTAVFSTAFVFIAHDKVTVMVMRMLTGCAAGAIYIPGVTLLSRWFLPSERGAAMGAYTAALTAAAAGGYFFAGPIAAAYGWRLGMLCTSVPVFLAVPMLILFVQEAPDIVMDKSTKQDHGLNDSGVMPAPAGGIKGPAAITGAYMGHMWELYAFWAWIGPFMVACASAAGMKMADAVQWGSFMAACITVAGAPAVWLMGKVADKIGRTRTIIICSLSSLSVGAVFGFLLGKYLIIVVLCGLWIGFWCIADSAVYKAGLTDMVDAISRGTFLGIQSALGFGVTIISPILFGKMLQIFNGNVEPFYATNWGPAFLLLAGGALTAPVLAFILRHLPQARLMSNGKM